MAKALSKTKIHLGLYYSGGLDWQWNDVIDTQKWRPLAPSQVEYGEYAINQLIELRDKFKPDILWNDLGWPKSTKDRLYAVFAEFYHNNANAVVNDRWGLPKVGDSKTNIENNLEI